VSCHNEDNCLITSATYAFIYDFTANNTAYHCDFTGHADPFANLLNKTQGLVDSIKSNSSRDPSMTEHPNIALERNNSDVTTTITNNNRYNIDGNDYGSAQCERNGNSVEEITGSMKTKEHQQEQQKLLQFSKSRRI
jgi:hypothetical protein